MDRLHCVLPKIHADDADNVGWFRVLNSRDLANGSVKQVYCLGLDLAVFRTEKGEAAILDAYCPHLGANLAAGGRVEGLIETEVRCFCLV